MNDLEIIFLFALVLAAILLPSAGVAAWRDFQRTALFRAMRAACTNTPATPPPPFTLLRSADGTVPLAQLRSGELRSLKPDPKGKAERKLWKRIGRTAPEVKAFMLARGGHRRPALVAALKKQSAAT